MNAKELKEYVADIPDDAKVHLICNGKIDETPSLNFVDDTLYLEGVTE